MEEYQGEEAGTAPTVEAVPPLVPIEKEEIEILGGTPWISIWVQPRATMRWIMSRDVGRHVVLLAILSGWVSTFDNAIGQSMGDTFGFLGTWIFILIVGPFAGLIGLYLGAAILGWSGRLLGGQGTTGPLRAAIAWGSVPQIVGVVLNLPILGIFGQETFTSATPRTDALMASNPLLAAGAGIILIGSGLLTLALIVWNAVIYLKCLGEAHGFSAWRALGAVLIPVAIIAVPAGLCIMALALQT